MSLGDWHGYRLDLGLPFLVQGRLSEVELVKHLGALQWRTVAATAGERENAIRDETGERLHFSLISLELGMPPGRGWEAFDEGTALHLHNRVGVFGKKLVEGHFVFDAEAATAAELAAVDGAEAMRRGPRPWACLAHGFATGSASSAARLATPAALVATAHPELERIPAGVAEHARVERSGAIEGWGDVPAAAPLAVRDDSPVAYQVMHESDVNAFGQVYCARYLAMMDYGERILLRRRLAQPLSAPLAACLSTERRKIIYFANADIEDTLQVVVEARVLPLPPTTAPSRWRTTARLAFRADLYRGADGVLMASSLVHKALVVPGHLKSLLTESERWLGRVNRAVV